MLGGIRPTCTPRTARAGKCRRWDGEQGEASPGAQRGAGSVPGTAQPGQQDTSRESTTQTSQPTAGGVRERERQTKDIKETKKGGGGDTQTATKEGSNSL